VCILEGNPAQGYRLAPWLGYASVAEWADFNGDGRLDLAIGDSRAASVSILEGEQATLILEFRLTVSDGAATSAPDTVQITVESAEIFSDGFESGDTSKWSSKKP
jgi:hypothetical protein